MVIAFVGIGAALSGHQAEVSKHVLWSEGFAMVMDADRESLTIRRPDQINGWCWIKISVCMAYRICEQFDNASQGLGL